jgi:hypothetical protein
LRYLIATIISALACCAAFVGVWLAFGEKVMPVQVAAPLVQALAMPGDTVVVTSHGSHLDALQFGRAPTIATSRVPLETDRLSRVILTGHVDDQLSSVARFFRLQGDTLLNETVGDSYVEVVQFKRRDTTVHDLMAWLPLATVDTFLDNGAVIGCPWNGTRFQCPQAEWVYVGLASEMLAGQPHRCIWTHPVDDGVVRVTWPDVTGANRVVGWYALTDYAAAVPDGSRVSIRLRAGTMVEEFAAQRQRGRRPIDVALPADHSGPLAIEFEAATSGVRHLCWSLRAVHRQEAT